MSIASGFHPDPLSGTISTTTSAANLHLATRVTDGATDDVTIFTESDAIRITEHEASLLIDMLIGHGIELRNYRDTHTQEPTA